MTDLSPVEQSVVDRFDAAPNAPESLRERVAEAMWEAVRDDTSWPFLGTRTRHRCRRAADAAIATITGGQS